MNLSLVDPFALAQEFPDTLSTTLQFGHATCIKFSPNGDYLASGLVDGGIVIFDLDTYGVLASLRGHTRPIESLSWSHTNRYLLSAGRDWKCTVWDLGARGTTGSWGVGGGKIKLVVNLEAPIWTAQFNPRNEEMFVASVLDRDAVLVDFSEQAADSEAGLVVPKIVTLHSSIRQSQKEPDAATEAPAPPEATEAEPEEEDGKKKPKKKGPKKKASAQTKKNGGNMKQDVLTAMFSPDGEYVITGTSRGSINITKTGTPEVVFSKSISSSKIKSMALSPSGRMMVVNSSDRVIRLLSMPDMRYPPPSSAEGVKKETTKGGQDAEWSITTEHKFQDVVNRLQWNSVAIAPSAEYIIASTFEDAQDIYMWDTSTGSLAKIYDGPKEELVEIEWHPTRPLIAATGLESGKIHLWTSVPPQRWSALAPDFIEVDENVVYSEGEDEFDRLNEDVDAGEDEDEGDEEVDVFGGRDTVVGTPGGSRMFVIPVSMEFDEEEKPDRYVSD